MTTKPGADPRFFLGGGAHVSCPTSTPINQIVFFLQNTSCIRKPQVISGAGVRAPCTLPLDPPLQTMAFEDQSTIPKATCIEIGVYHFVMRLLSRHSKTPPSSAPVLFHFSLSMADKL